jgi:hypothetical protein
VGVEWIHAAQERVHGSSSEEENLPSDLIQGGQVF